MTNFSSIRNPSDLCPYSKGSPGHGAELLRDGVQLNLPLIVLYLLQLICMAQSTEDSLQTTGLPDNPMQNTKSCVLAPVSLLLQQAAGEQARLRHSHCHPERRGSGCGGKPQGAEARAADKPFGWLYLDLLISKGLKMRTCLDLHIFKCLCNYPSYKQ